MSSPRFTRELDERLVQLASTYCSPDKRKVHWKKIRHEEPLLSEFSTQKLFQRYHRVLHPSLVRAPWSAEEDAKLLALVDQMGKHWSAISTHGFDNSRCDVWCKQRYDKLVKLKKKKKRKRGAPFTIVARVPPTKRQRQARRLADCNDDNDGEDDDDDDYNDEDYREGREEEEDDEDDDDDNSDCDEQVQQQRYGYLPSDSRGSGGDYHENGQWTEPPLQVSGCCRNRYSIEQMECTVDTPSRATGSGSSLDLLAFVSSQQESSAFDLVTTTTTTVQTLSTGTRLPPVSALVENNNGSELQLQQQHESSIGGTIVVLPPLRTLFPRIHEANNSTTTCITSTAVLQQTTPMLHYYNGGEKMAVQHQQQQQQLHLYYGAGMWDRISTNGTT